MQSMIEQINENSVKYRIKWWNDHSQKFRKEELLISWKMFLTHITDIAYF